MVSTDKPITFFRGETLDGARFVVSVVGGPTAANPTDKGEAGGLVCNGSKSVRYDGLSAAQGIELKNDLLIMLFEEL